LRRPAYRGSGHGTTLVAADAPGGRPRTLSPQQSKAILAGLASRGQETSIFDRHLALEEVDRRRAAGGGQQGGAPAGWPGDFPGHVRCHPQRARPHQLETYLIEDDEVGRKFAAALIEKQARGVQVNLIYDSVGAIGTPPEFFKRLTDRGVRVLEFNPVNPLMAAKGWDVNQRDHRKLLIVDGQVAFVGGINISSVYSSGSFRPDSKRKAGSAPWRDTHLQVEGPVVAEFQKLFLATWDKQAQEALAPRKYFPPQTSKGKDVVRAIGSSPDEQYSLMYATLISAIANARRACT
jgi:cardiolipin synthase